MRQAAPSGFHPGCSIQNPSWNSLSPLRSPLFQETFQGSLELCPQGRGEQGEGCQLSGFGAHQGPGCPSQTSDKAGSQILSLGPSWVRGGVLPAPGQRPGSQPELLCVWPGEQESRFRAHLRTVRVALGVTGALGQQGRWVERSRASVKAASTSQTGL